MCTRRVGIDWGSESHQVCRIDAGCEPKQRTFPHTGEGLKALVEFVVEEASIATKSWSQSR